MNLLGRLGDVYASLDPRLVKTFDKACAEESIHHKIW